MDVPRAARRIIIRAPSDPAKWPKPHPNTEAPKMATFTGVLHYDPVRKRSLTAVAGWRTRLASDGLAIPGSRGSRYDLYDDIGDDELEHRWREALPNEGLHRRFVYGLYGVSPEHGWWAVVYRQRRQLESLMAFGSDLAGGRAVSWPAMSLGLDPPALRRRWPALATHVSGSGASRWLVDPTMHTPSALVHRLLAVGVVPITMMTSNLALIDRRASTFGGVPWFAFAADDRGRRPVTVEVTAAGEARRLGPAAVGYQQIIDRCWGLSIPVVRRMRLRGVHLPESPEDTASVVLNVGRSLDLLARHLDQVAIASPSVEDALTGCCPDLRPVPLGGPARRVIVGASAMHDGEIVGHVDSRPMFLVKPTNRSIGDAPDREGGEAAFSQV